MDDQDVPTVELPVGGQTWPAVIDTGFNGDLELPTALQHHVNPRFLARERSILATGLAIEEDLYIVDFPFDGETVTAEASFVGSGPILVGTHLLRRHRLEIDFAARAVLIEKAP